MADESKKMDKINEGAETTEPENTENENGKSKKPKNPVVRLLNGIGRIHNWCKDKIVKHPTGASILIFSGGTAAGYALKGLVGLVSQELSKMEDEENEELLDNRESDSTNQAEEQTLMESPTEE